MKSHYYILGFLLFICNLSQPLNAQNTQEDLLLGTWTLNFNTTKQNMSEVAKNKYNNMRTELKTRISKSHEGRQFVFLQDGTFNQNLPSNKTTSGTWVISYGNLILTNTNNDKRTLFIEKLNTQHLILFNQEYPNGLISRLCFEKIKKD